MKLNNTFCLFDRGGIARTKDWEISHKAIADAIARISWPAGSDHGMKIPKIVCVKPGSEYTDRRGKLVKWNGGKEKKDKHLRNGVLPLRQMFRKLLEDAGWRAEEPLRLSNYFEKIRTDREKFQIFRYPVSANLITDDPLHEGVGNFDFSLRSSSGFRAVVEWETGNISSSHRSLNKMCLALMAGIADAAVLVVPSCDLKPHLTDRIGNIKELQPYFYLWHGVGSLVERGLLAVIEVEQDELFESRDLRDFIPTGADGNAFRAR